VLITITISTLKKTITYQNSLFDNFDERDKQITTLIRYIAFFICLDGKPQISSTAVFEFDFDFVSSNVVVIVVSII